MKSLTQALAKTAAVIEQTVQSTVHDVTGPKALQDYEMQEQIGSGGPGLIWKLYSGKHRNKSITHNQDVCIWLIDKKALGDARQKMGLSKVAEDAFLDIIRADAMQLVRLRHPGVVHVVQGLDESKGTMTMVTEPIFASIANVLGQRDNISKIPKELKDLEMGQLEIKHGLLQLAESLTFLHNNARLVHRSLSPETVLITSAGAWKLAGFGFAVSIDQVTTDMPVGPAYHYPEYDSEDLLLPLQPPLNYTAPELTKSGASFSCTSSDMYSLGCLAYHLLARHSLIDAKNNLKTYISKVTYLRSESLSDIPMELVNDLQRMLSMDENSRPSALEFTGSPFFRDDTRLRAIRFLDHMLERDNMQKTDFLKALAGMWTNFEARVLRYKVLPPLCAELRNAVMQPMVLPMVLTIAEAQEKSDFELTTFPALVPVLSSATGDSLLLMVKHASLLINKVSPDQLSATVVPMLVRAYDDSDARMQEEVLRCTLSVAKQLDFQVIRQTILPRLHNLALKTTVAVVRVNALLCLGELVQRLDKPSVLEILQTLRRCTAVDHSAPTLMCTLSVAGAIHKQYGIEFAAEHLLPLLSPLLVAQQLNLQQFSKYILFVKQILRKIEEKRGVALNECNPSATFGEQSVDSSKVVENGIKSSAAKLSSTWDVDDWASMAKTGGGSMTLTQNSVDSTLALTGSAKNTTASVPSVETLPNAFGTGSLFSTFEWPPPSFSASVAMPTLAQPAKSVNNPGLSNYTVPNYALDNRTKLETNGSSGNAGSMLAPDEFDPFADWPPRSSGTGSIGKSKQGFSIRPSSVVLSSTNSNDWGRMSAFGQGQKNEVDIGALLAPPKAQEDSQIRKLAPPPTGLGKGRGRNPLRPNRSPQTRSSVPTNQPPLMDLL